MPEPKYLFIHDWREHQTYRADRGQPPWIKIHRSLIRNPKFLSLSEIERGQLFCMWILAADNDGRIVADADVIRRACALDTEPDLNKFISLGLLDAKLTPRRRQVDANVTPTRRQRDAPEAEAETETETETEKKEVKSNGASAPPLTDVEKALFNWNIIAEQHGLPSARVLSAGRRRKLAARLRECGGLEVWNEALERIAEQPFLHGRNDRGWRCNIDFMLTTTGIAKVLEGNYGTEAGP